VGIDLTTYGVFHKQGEGIRLTITIAASEPITLYYRTTQRFEIVISDADGKEVWLWSKDRTFAEVLEQVSLKASETLSFDESWDQKDNDGQAVPTGNYTVTATSTNCDANYTNCGQLSTSGTIQIRPS
jgi:flagellar hook assembly protein FlgD